MAHEVEAKVRIDDPQAVRQRLRTRGGEFLRNVLEINHILESADGSLRRAGAGLRVREVQVLEGSAAPSTLTYKGPRLPSRFKSRPEIEVDVSDAGTTLELLAALGFRKVLSFRKRRESWRVGDCTIELDELPLLGRFVEIEGPDEDAVQRARALLDLAAIDHVQEGYVRMLLEATGGRGGALIDFTDTDNR